MLAVGVGSALNNSSSQNRLKQIAGPQAVKDAELANVDSLNDIDVALVTDFDKLAALMRGLVLELCSPSLTIQKLAQTPGSAEYAPASGWDMTVTPRVPTGNRVPLDPAGGHPGERDLDDGRPRTTAGSRSSSGSRTPRKRTPRDRGRDAQARLHGRSTWGGQRLHLLPAERERATCGPSVGDFADPTNPTFDLDPIGQEIVTCKVYNSFNYRPGIHLEKVNNPTEVRGDLADNPQPGDPSATVTSSYTVTNTGNTPLSSVHVTDDKCAKVVPVPATGTNVGDLNGDNLLDLDEAWQFTCDHQIMTGASTNPAGQVIINTATATGTPPVGAPRHR